MIKRENNIKIKTLFMENPNLPKKIMIKSKDIKLPAKAIVRVSMGVKWSERSFLKIANNKKYPGKNKRNIILKKNIKSSVKIAINMRTVRSSNPTSEH